MDIALVSLIVFVAITLCAVTGAMLFRDLVAGGNSSTDSRMLGGRGSLRRIPNVFDEQPAQTLTGKIDQGFDRLVLESGNGFSPTTFALMIIAGGLLVGGVVYSYYNNFPAGVAGAFIGMLLPIIVVSWQRSRRMNKVLEELPYVLDLMSRAVRAGKSLDQAIELIGRENDGVLGREFHQCHLQLQMGRALPAVMRSLSGRIRLVEMRIMATTLTVHRKTGGHLAETLERMSGVIRDRLTARRQMRATTGAGRSSALMIATLSPLAYIIMFMWQPEHIEILYTDPLGISLLVLAIVLELVGILWVIALLRNDS